MPRTAEYTWESSGSTYRHADPNRKLKVWLVIAAGVSVLAHAGLWMLFVNTTLPAGAQRAIEMMEQTRTFKIDRVTLNEVTLEEDRSEDETHMAEILDTDAAPLVKEINEDDPNIYDKLPEHQVRLTSEVDDMSKFLASERPAIRGENTELTESLEPLDNFSTEDLEETLKAMKSRVLPLAAQLSDDQITISVEDEDPGLIDGKDLEAFNNALAKAAGNAEITKGFSNLDDLLNRTGPLLDDTKPILIPTDLLFQFNQSDLQESARLSMMKLGLLIKRNQQSHFIIEGHTDTIGPEAYNMTLSLKRAQSVQDWLVESLGLGEDRISVEGFRRDPPAGAHRRPRRAGDQPPRGDRHTPGRRLAPGEEPESPGSACLRRGAVATLAPASGIPLAPLRSVPDGSSSALSWTVAQQTLRSMKASPPILSVAAGSVAVFALLVSPAQTAEVTWGTPFVVTQASDISNPGRQHRRRRGGLQPRERLRGRRRPRYQRHRVHAERLRRNR